MGTFKNPDVWKQNLAYQIGDFVLYNGTVYMAIKPVPAGTEMSAEYWTDFSNGGGGGSSDFTTAHVTVTGTYAGVSGYDFKVCVVQESEGITATSAYPFGSGASIEFDAILHKDGAVLTTGSTITATSGAILQLSEGAYLITGDCSITTA